MLSFIQYPTTPSAVSPQKCITKVHSRMANRENMPHPGYYLDPSQNANPTQHTKNAQYSRGFHHMSGQNAGLSINASFPRDHRALLFGMRHAAAARWASGYAVGCVLPLTPEIPKLSCAIPQILSLETQKPISQKPVK